MIKRDNSIFPIITSKNETLHFSSFAQSSFFSKDKVEIGLTEVPIRCRRL